MCTRVKLQAVSKIRWFFVCFGRRFGLCCLARSVSSFIIYHIFFIFMGNIIYNMWWYYFLKFCLVLKFEIFSQQNFEHHSVMLGNPSKGSLKYWFWVQITSYDVKKNTHLPTFDNVIRLKLIKLDKIYTSISNKSTKTTLLLYITTIFLADLFQQKW